VSSRSHLKRGSFGRGLAVSLAGLRAGGAYALGSAISRVRGEENDGQLMRREARRFVAELGRLKGSYVKIGQMLALFGEHFLPPALTEALHDLDSQTEPMPWAVIEEQLKMSLGSRYRSLEVDPRPLAAASLAQVHRARHRDSGEELVLKIQYPGLADVIDTDFDAVVRMLTLARWLRAGRDLDDWLADMRQQLHHEIDYAREAAMTRDAFERVRSDASLKERYHVPAVHEALCTDTVLALDYVDGLRVTQADVAQLPQRRRDALGAAMLELFFIELYQWGTLQTDPNFGNYLIEPRGRGDRLVLLDFGSTLRCEDRFLRDFGSAIAAGQVGDRPALVSSLKGLGCLPADASDFACESFSEFCEMLLEPLRPPEQLPREFVNGRGEYCWGRSRLMHRVGKHAASSAATRHFATPSRDFALIVRKLSGVFTFITVLDAQFNAHDMVHRYIDDWQQSGDH
jgi:predicted unusual protein kinase regulating ubiquinone biosynthesis (AarF/ABC1/UbiB family)